MQILKSLGCLAILTFLSGCGANGIVTNISVETNVNTNNEQIVSLETYLNLGSLKLPALTLPVMDPKNSSQQIGAVVLSRSVDGLNVITLEANASKILAGQISPSGTLPNGNALPLASSAGVATIQISSYSKLYLGGGPSPFVGFALVIPEFNSLGNLVSGYSLFLPLASNLGVNGVAGVFSGGPSQNGIGLFVAVPNGSTGSAVTLASSASAVKRSSSSPGSSVLSKGSQGSSLARFSKSAASNEETLTFIATDENTSKSKKLKNALGSMSQKKTQLRVK